MINNTFCLNSVVKCTTWFNQVINLLKFPLVLLESHTRETLVPLNSKKYIPSTLNRIASMLFCWCILALCYYMAYLFCTCTQTNIADAVKLLVAHYSAISRQNQSMPVFCCINLVIVVMWCTDSHATCDMWL